MSIDERFHTFHTENPHVYRELVTLARQAHDRGYRRIGIELLFSALRWRSMMRTTADQYGFKLNDHYTSRYARLIMSNEPDLTGLFALRCLRTALPPMELHAPDTQEDTVTLPNPGGDANPTGPGETVEPPKGCAGMTEPVNPADAVAPLTDDEHADVAARLGLPGDDTQ